MNENVYSYGDRHNAGWNPATGPARSYKLRRTAGNKIQVDMSALADGEYITWLYADGKQSERVKFIIKR